jgi:DNA-directed RNA polymerase
MASFGTRIKSRHSVIGFAKELTKNVLPTSEDIFRAYCFYQQNEMHQSVNDIAKAVATEVIEMYNTASIPAIAFDSVVKKSQKATRERERPAKIS